MNKPSADQAKEQLRITIGSVVSLRLSRLAQLEGVTSPKIAQMLLYAAMLKREEQYRNATGKSVEQLCDELGTNHMNSDD